MQLRDHALLSFQVWARLQQVNGGHVIRLEKDPGEVVNGSPSVRAWKLNSALAALRGRRALCAHN